MTGAVEEMQAAGLLGDIPITMVAGPRRVPVRRGEGAARGHRGPRPAAAAVPAVRARPVRDRAAVGWEAHDTGARPCRRAPVEPHAGEQRRDAGQRPHVLARGAEWFRSMGTERVARPRDRHRRGRRRCTPRCCRDRAGHAAARRSSTRSGGGTRAGRQVKAVLSGIANPVVTAPDQLGTPVSYEGMAAAGSGLGRRRLRRVRRPGVHGRGGPRLLALPLRRVVQPVPRLQAGLGRDHRAARADRGGRATELDVDTIGARLKTVTDGNRCYLPVQEQAVVSSLLRSFPEEFAEHLEGRPCPRPGRVVVPKLVDLADGTAPTTSARPPSGPTGPTPSSTGRSRRRPAPPGTRRRSRTGRTTRRG